MGTTRILAEILGIGFQGLFVAYGIARVTLSVPNFSQFDPFKITAGAVTVVIASAYILGTLLDRLCDFLVSRIENRIRASILLPYDPNFMRYAVNHESAEIHKVLEYIRARIRIGRATFIMPLIVLVIHVIYACIYGQGFWVDAGNDIVQYAIYIVLSVSGLLLFYESQRKYFKRVSMCYHVVREAGDHTDGLRKVENQYRIGQQGAGADAE
jgi:hypothetical protein